MQPVEPIETAHLFAPLHDELMTLMRGLSPADWERPTAAGRWTVKDVIVHLLDGNMRQISFRRDKLRPVDPPFPIRSYEDLVRFLDDLNAIWVEAFGRVSPQLLVELHAQTGPEVARIFADQDPQAPAIFGVAWAGEESSPNWFDAAREYTERWHHQQQIRDAVGAEPLTDPRWLHPVIDTFMRALPHAYRDQPADPGTHIAFEVSGRSGGAWSLQRADEGWRLWSGDGDEATCRVRTSADTTWRLLTKGLTPEQARQRVEVAGPEHLGTPFLNMLAIMGLRSPAVEPDDAQPVTVPA